MSANAMSRVYPLSVVVLLVAGGGLTVASLRAQSLADIAKKEEDRRKTVPAPAKVYTNKDLNVAPGDGPPPPAVATASKAPDDAAKATDADAKAGGSKQGDGADKGPLKDQAYWATKLKTLQDSLARDENYADAMQTRINALTTDFVNRDDPA